MISNSIRTMGICKDHDLGCFSTLRPTSTVSTSSESSASTSPVMETLSPVRTYVNRTVPPVVSSPVITEDTPPFSGTVEPSAIARSDFTAHPSTTAASEFLTPVKTHVYSVVPLVETSEYMQVIGTGVPTNIPQLSFSDGVYGPAALV
ncbi:hypothetical protein P171DRAFT_194187 [Karstenula rhodostoma CBS 690.94]|uniref:Uncharacterized protein n=1 Tax=Karstenula rhodostoma CBS 690.94 TaxID=1392251 RepID=A0A9P4PVD9_9PLEO|nr:hypothetical protein P171DRAFT_194187 [Karstenula rhodostoma CBS 690.94]